MKNVENAVVNMAYVNKAATAAKPDFSLIDEELLKSRIHTIRGVKVMLDVDLAEIYGYSTKAFNQQVKNNIEKFDEDFRFQLNNDELAELSRSYLTSKQGKFLKRSDFSQVDVLRSKMGMRTNSWTQLEDVPCNSQKNKSPRPLKPFTI